jgi:glycerophosphoryl diester phosphodiesterase
MFAHRGARAHARENTLEAFTLGLRLGASGLESDVWLSRDGVAVLDHDGLIGRRPRRRSITAFDREQLPVHIPSLDDLYDECGIDFHLSLDLKDADAADVVVKTALDRDGSAAERTWLCHPDLDVLADLRSRFPSVRLVHSTRLNRLQGGPERHAARLREARIDTVNMHQQDWTGGLATLFHRFEVLAFGWDMQFEHQLRPALRMGLDAVYSDHVDVMVDVYRDEIGEV